MGRQCQSWVIRVLLCAALVAAAPRAAKADPVQITSGFLTVYWDGCCAGFSVSGPDFSMGVIDSFHVRHSIGTLTAGTLADPNLSIGAWSRGAAAVDGVPVVNPADPFTNLIYFAGHLAFDTTPFLVTDPGTLFATYTTRFTMTGNVQGYSTFERSGAPLFSVELRGQGSVQVGPMRRFEGPGGVTFAAINANQIFTFEPLDASPTPEPATLFLLGTGLAGVALRARRRQGSSSQGRN